MRVDVQYRHGQWSVLLGDKELPLDLSMLILRLCRRSQPKGGTLAELRWSRGCCYDPYIDHLDRMFFRLPSLPPREPETDARAERLLQYLGPDYAPLRPRHALCDPMQSFV